MSFIAFCAYLCKKCKRPNQVQNKVEPAEIEESDKPESESEKRYASNKEIKVIAGHARSESQVELKKEPKKEPIPLETENNNNNVTSTNSMIGATTTAMNDVTDNGTHTMVNMLNIGENEDNENISALFKNYQVKRSPKDSNNNSDRESFQQD